MTQKEMQSILEIGTAISSEKDYNRLLEMILNRIMELPHADAGTLYLADGDVLRFKIMRNNTMHTYEGGDGKEPNLPPVKLSRENVCAMKTGRSALKMCGLPRSTISPVRSVMMP